MKKIIISAALILVACIVAGCLQAQPAGTAGSSAGDGTGKTDGFRFSLRWGTYGISSYDSGSGRLVKTTDATDPDRYVTEMHLSEKDLEYVAQALKALNIASYPSSYDPFNAPGAETMVASEPSTTIVLSATFDGRTATVTCPGIADLGENDCYSEQGKNLIHTVKELIAMITGTPEWQALPEYEFFYE